MNNKFTLELLLWAVTILITGAVLAPILFVIKQQYPFYLTNVIFIVAFVTFTRYIFLLPHTFLARRQVLKIGLFFLCIPAVFLLIQELNFFQTFLDEEGIAAVVGDLPAQMQKNMLEYVRSEMLLFGVGSIISGVILPFRLLASVWRYRNRGRA